MKTIDLILTPFEGKQYFKEIELEDAILLRNEETLKAVILSHLTKEQKAIICKVSCCVIGLSEQDAPSWYNECNGKLWFNDDKRKQYGLD